MNEETAPLIPEPYRFVWHDPVMLQQIRACLVGVTRKNDEKAQIVEHLEELNLLAETQKIPVVCQVLYSCRTINAATFIGQGKVEELQKKMHDEQINLVIFDDDITPAQQRNLEKLLKAPVIDRTEVILGVFAMRAKSREAKLQVELAQVKYLLPRLKRLWTHLSRQVGGGGGKAGGGYLKGEGEKQIEIDRRILKRRISRLEKEIAEIKEYREVQRAQRTKSSIPVLAIVGYTNAGKSTLMHALTGADVYIEDKLFATLDTTTRKHLMSNNQEVLLIDTVGFIRKLPHLLVAAFRSTLEEAIFADLILHVIDASHKMAFEQAETTFEVLKELDAHDTPIITVLNKIDKIGQEENETFQRLKLRFPRTVEISAASKVGLPELEEEIIHRLQDRRARMSLRIPQKDYHMLALVLREGKIFHQEYDENDVLIDIEVPANLAFRFTQFKCE